MFSLLCLFIVLFVYNFGFECGICVLITPVPGYCILVTFFLSGAIINDYISMNLGKYSTILWKLLTASFVTGRNLSLSAFNFLSSVSAGTSFVDPYP